MAVFDSSLAPYRLIIPVELIDADVLKGIEADLELFEKISCLFLLIEDYRLGYSLLQEVEMYAETAERQILSKFVGVLNWQDKLLEAVCLLKNEEILVKLGIDPQQARTMFLTKVPGLEYKINKYAKAFYHLFENMSKDKQEKVLTRIYREIPKPNWKISVWDNFLELHLLWWIENKFIQISLDQKTWQYKKLLNILKAMKLTDMTAYETLENLQNINNSPCHYDDNSNNCDMLTNTAEPLGNIEEVAPTERYKINTGLVIIFNQMKFSGPIEYDYRDGSQVDCDRIITTFKNNFGFDTIVHTDLKQAGIYHFLDDLRNSAKQYDCIVVFILSHGTLGNVIASDCKECPIATIRKKICCKALQGKPKVLVIQACQTEEDKVAHLTTDGPGLMHNGADEFRDFMMFNSTIPGDLSVRHAILGTWFIQILCEVLEELGIRYRSVEDCIREVINRFSKKRDIIDGKSVGQIPEIRHTMGKHLFFPRKSQAINGKIGSVGSS